MRWGRFHICEHDFVNRLKGGNSMAKDKKAAAAPEAEEKAPKQKRLPEMEDPAIEEIEDAALQYASVRDRRMALTDKEVEAKDFLLAQMKKHDKLKYYRHTKKGVIDVQRVPEGEKLKVKITDED